jgi:hypothetical protein
MVYKQHPRKSLPEIREPNKNSRKLWKGFASIFVTIASFLVASQIIDSASQRTVSTLDMPALSTKLEDMGQEDGKYDFVFLGSSRVFRGINPTQIEAEARKQACDLRIYNFGIGGMSLIEQKYILNQLYELGIDIGTIFIEPYSVTNLKLDDYIADRRRYFYTWNNLPDLLLDQFTNTDVIPYKLRNLAYLLFGFAHEKSGVGRLSYLLFPQQPKAQKLWNKPIQKGHIPLDEEYGQIFDSRRKQFALVASKLEKKIEAAALNPMRRTSSGNRFKIVLGVTDEIRRYKIEPAIIIMPHPRQILHSSDLEERLVDDSTETLPIINLNRPDYYSDLFMVENFFDGAHLNRRGAAVLAKYLAPELCALQSVN